MPRESLWHRLTHWFQAAPAPAGQRSVIYEVTTRCNLACRYCYNVWNETDYARDELDTTGALRLVERIREQTGCMLLTFTGGEPLLRTDLELLVRHARLLGMSCNLITNGTLLTPERARSLVEAGIGLFETPLLGSDGIVVAGLHGTRPPTVLPATIDHSLPRAESRGPSTIASVPDGSHVLSRTQSAILDITQAGGEVVTAFVATRANIDQALDAARLSFALGAAGMMFNRFNPGGRGGTNRADLLPAPDQLARALGDLDRFAADEGFPVSCSIPIPPCVLDTTPYSHLSFGYCAAATDRAYYTVDPAGRLRMCNHSPSVLGSLLDESFEDLTARSRTAFFLDPVPEFCKGCPHLATCRCCCRAAAESCLGDLTRLDPFVEAHGRR
jgi:radical SAM protein with 4Fe4S-binding SPASM domain